MNHITVAQLQALLMLLPPKVRIAPSVGRASLIIWSQDDDEIIGSIHPAGEGFEIEMNVREVPSARA